MPESKIKAPHRRRNGQQKPHLERLLLFARNFVKHPLMLGSFVPSSRFLIDRLLDQIDFSTATVFVEYGPGVGPITTALLRRMRPDSHLVAFEMNAELAEYLRESVDDARLHVVTASAAHARQELEKLGLSDADYVVSGIPFTTMPGEVRRQVVRATRDVLKPGGAFLVYQFSRTVLSDLRATFPDVSEQFEPRNFPPAQLFYARTTGNGAAG